MTPLIVAVDAQHKSIFRFLFTFMKYVEQNQNIPILRDSIDVQDTKSETALIKAIRTGQTDAAKMIIEAVHEHTLKYEVLLPVDITQKNALHHAVMTKNKEIIEKLLFLDCDHQKLRQ